MSQYSDFQCRWNWCRDTYPSILELLDHVKQAHVQKTEPCCLRDIPLLVRAEEGLGESMSGMTVSYGNYSQSEAQNHSIDPAPNPSSLPSPPATSPIPNVQSPTADSNSLQSTPERPVKRRRVMLPDNDPLSRFNSARPPSPVPSPRGQNNTPSFSMLARRLESTTPVQNPIIPDFNALMAGISAHKSSPSSQSFSGSDCSVERQLTQSIDMDFDASFADVTNLDDEVQRASGSNNSGNLYAGELNWAEEPSPELPRSRSQTPSHSSQSQPQPQSPSQPQSSPRRVQDSLFKAQNPVRTPTKTYLSGSLKISPLEASRQPDGGTAIPRDILSQSKYFELTSQSASQIASSFVLQTQAPYRSQSISQ